MVVKEYDTSIGEFIKSLDKPTQSKITKATDLLEKNGHTREIYTALKKLKTLD